VGPEPSGYDAADVLASADFADLRAAFDFSPCLVTVVVGPEHVLVYQNPASVRAFGPRRLGVPVRQAFPTFSDTALARAERVRVSGQTVAPPGGAVATRDADGRELLLRYVFTPLGVGLPAAGVVQQATDVTAEEQAARAAWEYRFLGDLSERMSAAADPDRALQELTDALVPRLADVAAVYVLPLTAGGLSARPAATTVAPSLSRLGEPPSQSEPAPPWRSLLADGRPIVVDLGTPGVLGQDPAAQWVRSAGGHTVVVLPLVLAGELSGTVVLMAAGDRAAFGVGDLPFLERVAVRAGAAVSYLRSYRQQRQIALDLQQALLPETPSAHPGLQVAVRYVAGADDVDVGGDWWEVHRRGEGTTGVGVGDVSGRGVAAAVVMGQARAAMRAAALADLQPAALLRLLDAQLAEVLETTRGGGIPPRFATAAYVVLDHRRELLRVACAGHPPPLVRRPDGVTEVVDVPAGAPLGLGVGGYVDVVVPFPTGSLLVAFTDGLVESREVDVDTGIHRARVCLRTASPEVGVEELADALLTAAGRPETHEDDLALVVVRSVP